MKYIVWFRSVIKKILLTALTFSVVVVALFILLEFGLHLYYLGFSTKPKLIKVDYTPPILFDLQYSLLPNTCVSTRFLSREQRKWKHSWCINNDGFRKNGASKNKEGEPRIVILGDSWVFGLGVNDSETFPSQLEKLLLSHLPETEVLNFGVPGYNTVQAVEWYLRYGEKYQPDLIILTLSILDHTRPWFTSKLWCEISKHSFVALTIQTYLYCWYTINFSPEVGASFQLKAINTLLNNLSSSNLCIAILAPGETTDYVAQHYKSVGVNIIDLRPIYNIIQQETLLIPNDSHPTAKGYALYAQALVPFIVGLQL